MKIYGTESNQILLQEVGSRIRDTRIAASVTQEDLAAETGLSLSTIKRIEHGGSVRIDSLFSIMRYLGLLQNIELLIPEQKVLPTELLDRGGKRKRASSKKQTDLNGWKWGDEA